MVLPRGVLVLIGCTALASASCVAEIFQDAPHAAVASEQSDGRQGFDIPAQALMTALRQYSEQTGVSVLFDDKLVRGHDTHGASGRYLPPEALDQLLADTGLVAHYASPMAFTLMAAESPETASPPVDDASDTAMPERFTAQLQASLVSALCSSPSTQPGRYRLALQLWLDASGAVTRTNLLGSTGESARDAQIGQLASAMHLGDVPSSVPQPVTILLLPRPASHPFDCSRHRAG